MPTFEDDIIARLEAPPLPPENQKITVLDKPIEQMLAFENSPTKEHQELLTKLIKRRDMGYDVVKARYERWDDVDDFLRMRLDLDKHARLSDGTYDTKRKEMPFDRTIVVPISFAMMQTRLVQKMGVILGRNPPLQVTGASPEDVLGARLMSAALGFDSRKSNIPLALHQAVWDTERYNISILYDTWEVENGIILRPPPMYGTMMFDAAKKTLGKMYPKMFEWQRDWGKRCEHNRVLPIDPRRFYPDPRVSFARAQEGEFIGHGTLQGLMYLKEREQRPDDKGGPYFNLDAVKKHCGYRGDIAKRWYTPQQTYKVDELDRGVYCVDHMQIKLIPREWGLGPGENPEIWWFTWVDDAVIIRCHASEFEHDKFTYSLSEAILDYHCTDNPGYGENMVGIQSLIDWLFGSHVENTRRIINASFIYPPSLIEEADLINPVPAGHIRLTQRGEELLMQGRITPQQIIQQLDVSSPTTMHLQTMNILTDQAMRMFAANDPVQGMAMPTERTLGEIQTIMAAASNRVAHDVRIMDMMALQPLTDRLVSNRRQFTKDEQWYQIVGDAANSILELAANNPRIAKTIDGIRALIGPPDLQGEYDYVPVTPMSGADPAKKAETWQQAMMAIAQMQQSGGFNPELYPDGRVPDFRAILNEMLRTLGIHNVEQYYIEMESAKLGAVAADFQNHSGAAQLAMQAMEFNQMAEQYGFPPYDMGKIMGLVQVVPDEEYARGVQSGQYATQEEVV